MAFLTSENDDFSKIVIKSSEINMESDIELTLSGGITKAITVLEGSEREDLSIELRFANATEHKLPLKSDDFNFFVNPTNKNMSIFSSRPEVAEISLSYADANQKTRYLSALGYWEYNRNFFSVSSQQKDVLPSISSQTESLTSQIKQGTSIVNVKKSLPNDDLKSFESPLNSSKKKSLKNFAILLALLAIASVALYYFVLKDKRQESLISQSNKVFPDTTANPVQKPIHKEQDNVINEPPIIQQEEKPKLSNANMKVQPITSQEILQTEKYDLRLSGSNTIGSNLIPNLIESWLISMGGKDVIKKQKNIDSKRIPEIVISCKLNEIPFNVEIKSHGSSNAFADLYSGNADIGMSSRPIKDDEKSLLSNLGDLTSAECEHIIGLDGIAVIVPPGKQLSSLTLNEIAKIFSGEVKDWSEISAGNGNINVYARDEHSGTYDTFRQLVLKNKDITLKAKKYEDSIHLDADVAKDPLGIGFLGLPFTKLSTPLAVSDGNTLAFLPNVLTVKKEDYILTRRLFLYTSLNPKNEYVIPFIKYIQSEIGQNIVKQTGFVDQSINLNLKPDTQMNKKNCILSSKWPQDKEAYCKLINAAKDLGITFRFRINSSEFDNRSKMDIQRIFSLLSKNEHHKLSLIGFADSKGDYYANIKLSQDRASSVKKALNILGIDDVEIQGFGPEIPVADNETSEGRERNRRVEARIY